MTYQLHSSRTIALQFLTDTKLTTYDPQTVAFQFRYTPPAARDLMITQITTRSGSITKGQDGLVSPTVMLHIKARTNVEGLRMEFISSTKKDERMWCCGCRGQSVSGVVKKNIRYVLLIMNDTRSVYNVLSRLEMWSPVVTKTVKFTLLFPGPLDRRGKLGTSTRLRGLDERERMQWSRDQGLKGPGTNPEENNSLSSHWIKMRFQPFRYRSLSSSAPSW